MKRRFKRKKKSQLLRFLKGFAENWLVRRTVLVLICFILVVNTVITAMGASGAFLLSPFHMDNKLRAIGHFASHIVKRAGQPESMSPKEALTAAASRQNAPRRLVFAIAKAESDFVPWRVSHTGAMGLMQLMPDTAAELGVKDPFHPRDNADGGAKYIAQLYRKYRGDIRRVAAAYNWGPARVPSTGPYQVPAETRRYVQRVVRFAAPDRQHSLGN